MNVETITWHDAYHQAGWTDVKDIDLVPHLVISVGLVIKETDTHVGLSIGYNFDNDDTLVTLAIPKGMIQSRTVLKEEKP